MDRSDSRVFAKGGPNLGHRKKRGRKLNSYNVRFKNVRGGGGAQE